MKKRLYIWLLGMLLISCYDDLGNYDYVQVNEVGISLKSSFGVKREYQHLVIRPEISQSQMKNMDNLQFVWTGNITSEQYKGDTLSVADSVVLVIDPEAENYSDEYFLRLYVTDQTTGATQMYPTVVKVTKPYEAAWMVLHTQENTARLGAIEYLSGDMGVTNDAFYKETGRRLRGTATRLGYATYFVGYYLVPSYYKPLTQFWCFTSDPDESGVLVQSQKFRKYDSISRCVFPGHLAEFDCKNVRVMDGTDKGPVCVTNGNVFHGTSSSCKLYKMHPQDGIEDPAKAAVSGPVYVTHGTASGATSLTYDSLGHRFLHSYFYGTNSDPFTFNEAVENTWRLEYVRKTSGNVDPAVADPDHIGDDKEMVYMGAGYHNGGNPYPWYRTAIYAVAKNKTQNEAYVYEFRSTPLWNAWNETENTFPNFYTVTVPEGFSQQTPMASSWAYNRLLFYAIGNKVYRLDFSIKGGASVMIYEHPNGKAKATVMKMARQYGNSPKAEHTHYGHDLTRSLAIVFDMPDGSGEVVVLNLSLSGKVDEAGEYPSLQVHSADADGLKFGKIKDLAFI